MLIIHGEATDPCLTDPEKDMVITLDQVFVLQWCNKNKTRYLQCQVVKSPNRLVVVRATEGCEREAAANPRGPRLDMAS